MYCCRLVHNIMDCYRETLPVEVKWVCHKSDFIYAVGQEGTWIDFITNMALLIRILHISRSIVMEKLCHILVYFDSDSSILVYKIE